MPSVGDLDRVGKRSLRRDPIAASTIAGDDADLRLLGQPGLSRGRLPVGQKSDRRMSFKIADQRAVAVIAPPGPVINADNRGRQKASWSTPAYHAQQRIVAHLDVEPARKGGSRPASERNGETVDHIVEAARTSGSWFDGVKPFGEDPPRASRSITEPRALRTWSTSRTASRIDAGGPMRWPCRAPRRRPGAEPHLQVRRARDCLCDRLRRTGLIVRAAPAVTATSALYFISAPPE